MTVLELASDLTLTLFERHVKQALRMYDQPERLGRESPLASPYMLGRALAALSRPDSERARGEALCSEIRAAAAQLWRGPMPTCREEMLAAIAEVRRDPDDSRYAYVVLELRCFHDYVAPHRTSDIWEQPNLLPGSKSQHYRDFDNGVKQLAALLLERLRPALRPERPRPPEKLYGYDRQLGQLCSMLEQGLAVGLSGTGGVGKTSIAAAALARLHERSCFWYTLRPGFNDGVNSLLFALAVFLHEQGAPNLWRYLATANGVVGDLNLAAGLLREDLATFEQRPPIICLDDLENISAGDLALLSPGHAQMLDLIEGLRGTAPLLLIGQRGLPSCDQHIELAGMSIVDLEQLWHGVGLELSHQEAERLHVYSGGNPRLLTLLLALGREGEDVIPHNGDTEATRSLLPAFERLWRRLRPEERRALQRLAVYQSHGPEEVIPAATLEVLARLRLIDRDGRGGVTLLPALGPIVRGGLSPELREQLHDAAAIVHLERGAYTAAAYHFAQSSQENRAVQVWFPQRRQAVALGEADAARLIFNGISRQRLDAPERKALDVIRAELRQLAGQYEDGLQELEQIDWSDESEASARLWMLRGELQDALGYPDQALESYGSGLRVTARLLGQLVVLRQRRGLLSYRRRNLKASWQEIQRAEFDLEDLRGLVQEEEGAYNTALETYKRGRELAEELDDNSLRAQSERRLAGVYGRREQAEQAVAHAMNSIAIYEQIGDRVNLEKMRSNLSAIYVQTRQFHQALEIGAPTYGFFLAIGDPYFAAVTAANLAEASFELGDHASAARYASEVLGLGDRFAAPYAHFTLGQVAMARHDTGAAATHFSESMELARQNDDPYMVAYAQRSLGQACLAASLPVAEQHIREALALFRQLGIPSESATTEQLLADLQA